MPHVFISYSRKDAPFVERLDRDLRSQGILTWRDQHSIPGGEEWFRAIKSALHDSIAVLYIDTVHAEASKWVEKEYLYAEFLGLKIIPIKLDPQFISLQGINLNPVLCDDTHYTTGLTQIAAILETIAHKPRTAHSTIPDRTQDEIDYLEWLLIQMEADLRSAQYVSLLATPEKVPQKVARLGLPGGRRPALERLGMEQLHGKALSEIGDTVPDARVPLRELRRVVLLGEPGAGKTTTLLQLTVDLAKEAQKDAQAKLPVFIPLRAFQGDMPFVEFIRGQMATLQSQYERLLGEGRLVLLLDALNEMPRLSPDRRDLVAEVRDYLRDKPNWMVSCRVRDYQEDLNTLPDVGKVRLKPFDLPRIYEVIQKRFQAIPEQGNTL